MANTADPINHDGVTTVGTVASKALKWGFIGVLAAMAVPLTFGAASIGLGYIAATATVSTAGTIALTAGALMTGALALLTSVGSATLGLTSLGVGSIFTTAGIAGAVGGGLGVLKGADQVSRESSAFRSRVTARMQGAETTEIKKHNDMEIAGIQEGYAIAAQDMSAKMAQASQEAYQKGQESVVAQIQEQMMKAAAAEAGNSAAAAQQPVVHQPVVHQPAASHEKKHADKFSKVECKAEAIVHHREEQAATPRQI